MRRIAMAILAGATMLAIPATAFAEVSLSKAQVLRHQGCYGPGATFTGWTSAEGDSPLDTNTKAYVFDVPSGGCGALFSRKAAVTGLNKTVDQVHNLSFDFIESGHVGAGAPRISVQFANGDIGYLSAFYCNQPLAVSGGTWGRADFTGSNLSNSTPCELQVTGTTGGSYDSTATQSAWDVYAAAHPSQVVTATYLVGDEPGHYVIDRLSLGAGFMYDKSNTTGVACQQDETRC